MDALPIILLVVWLVLSALGSRKQRKSPPRPRPPRPGGEDAQPRESVFERFQREMERLQAEMEGRDAGPMGRRGDFELEGAEEVEVLDTWNTERDLRDFDRPVPDRTREVVDQDTGAERLVRRRIREAEVRNRPLTAADHARFDQRIRDAAAASTVPVVTRGPRRARTALQRAIVWREILGPPVALRDD